MSNSKRRKQVTMTVTVSCPSWLSARDARREVRTLINEQCFYGNNSTDVLWEEIDSGNFRAAKVIAP